MMHKSNSCCYLRVQNDCTIMSNSKPRVVKDYDKLAEEIQEQIKIAYPFGYAKHLVHFVNAQGVKVSALPFETEEKYYLVRMTLAQAKQIILDDDDYADGTLRKAVQAKYEDKYGDDEEDDYDDDYDDDEDDLSDNDSPSPEEVDFDQIADED